MGRARQRTHAAVTSSTRRHQGSAELAFRDPAPLDFWLSRVGNPMLVIKRADEDGDFQGIDAVGRKFEMSVSALRNLDYKRASAQEIASNFPALSLPKSELSARAWGVLHLVAEGVADICAFGMDPCDFRTIASTTSLSEAQLRTTLSALVRRGLLATWFREDDRASASAYVPTIAGIIALAEDAPTPEGVLATRRAANLMPAA